MGQRASELGIKALRSASTTAMEKPGIQRNPQIQIQLNDKNSKPSYLSNRCSQLFELCSWQSRGLRGRTRCLVGDRPGAVRREIETWVELELSNGWVVCHESWRELVPHELHGWRSWAVSGGGRTLSTTKNVPLTPGCELLTAPISVRVMALWDGSGMQQMGNEEE